MNRFVKITILPQLLVALLAGCGRTPAPDSPAHKEAGPEAATEQRAVDHLLDLMRQRLLIMHEVARHKWHARLPLTDAKREQEILDEVVKQGRALGLEPDLVREFFHAQMHAGKLIQQADFDHWKDSGEGPPKTGPDLGALRRQIDALNAELLDALGKAGPWPKGESLRDRASTILKGHGITDAVRQAACEPLLHP